MTSAGKNFNIRLHEVTVKEGGGCVCVRSAPCFPGLVIGRCLNMCILVHTLRSSQSLILFLVFPGSPPAELIYSSGAEM